MPTHPRLFRESLTEAGLTKPGVDAHIHLWLQSNLPAVVAGNVDLRPDLNRDFRAEHFAPLVNPFGIRQLIAVQARDPEDDGERETERLVAVTERFPGFSGVIAGIDLLLGEENRTRIERLKQMRRVLGVRMIAPENLGVGIYSHTNTLASAALLGEANLTLDLLVRERNPGQLAELVQFVGSVLATHNCRMVLNHLGKPIDVGSNGPSKEWLEAMKAIGRSRRVYVKLSGLRGEGKAETNPRLFYPFYDAAFMAFGTEFLIFGTDHPVSHDYGACVMDVAGWILDRGLGKTGIANRIFHDNAHFAYGLPAPA